MKREANIKKKSTKTPVLIYRLCLKICFSALTLLCALTIQKGFAVDDRLYSLSLSFAVIFALLYQIIYYFYKANSGDIKYNINKEPIKYQIFFMSKILIFLLGVVVIVLGGYIFYRYTRSMSVLGSVIILIGFFLSQLIYNNTSVFSHLSTFFTNITSGFVIYSIYYGYSYSLDFGFFIIMFIAFLGIVMAEISFYFYNKVKHRYDKISKSAQQKIRIMYALRNIIALVIIYFVIIILIITKSLQVFEHSNIFDYIIKVLPILISLTTVSVLLYNNFKKPVKKVVTFAPVKEEESFVKKLREDYPKDGILLRSLDFVLNNMNTKKGYSRYSGEDYYFHPLNVAKILQDQGITDEETLSAALLHDCIEDLPYCDHAKIAELTNDKVAYWVDLLSKRQEIDYKNEEIMRLYLDNISKESRALAVKVADRMHNMSTLSNISEEKRAAKWAETKKFYLPILNYGQSKYPEYKKLFDTAKSFFEMG